MEDSCGSDQSWSTMDQKYEKMLDNIKNQAQNKQPFFANAADQTFRLRKSMIQRAIKETPMMTSPLINDHSVNSRDASAAQIKDKTKTPQKDQFLEELKLIKTPVKNSSKSRNSIISLNSTISDNVEYQSLLDDLKNASKRHPLLSQSTTQPSHIQKSMLQRAIKENHLVTSTPMPHPQQYQTSGPISINDSTGSYNPSPIQKKTANKTLTPAKDQSVHETSSKSNKSPVKNMSKSRNNNSINLQEPRMDESEDENHHKRHKSLERTINFLHDRSLNASVDKQLNRSKVLKSDKKLARSGGIHNVEIPKHSRTPKVKVNLGTVHKALSESDVLCDIIITEENDIFVDTPWRPTLLPNKSPEFDVELVPDLPKPKPRQRRVFSNMRKTILPKVALDSGLESMSSNSEQNSGFKKPHVPVPLITEQEDSVENLSIKRSLRAKCYKNSKNNDASVVLDNIESTSMAETSKSTQRENSITKSSNKSGKKNKSRDALDQLFNDADEHHTRSFNRHVVTQNKTRENINLPPNDESHSIEMPITLSQSEESIAKTSNRRTNKCKTRARNLDDESRSMVDISATTIQREESITRTNRRGNKNKRIDNLDLPPNDESRSILDIPTTSIQREESIARTSSRRVNKSKTRNTFLDLDEAHSMVDIPTPSIQREKSIAGTSNKRGNKTRTENVDESTSMAESSKSKHREKSIKRASNKSGKKNKTSQAMNDESQPVLEIPTTLSQREESTTRTSNKVANKSKRRNENMDLRTIDESQSILEIATTSIQSNCLQSRSPIKGNKRNKTTEDVELENVSPRKKPRSKASKSTNRITKAKNKVSNKKTTENNETEGSLRRSKRTRRPANLPYMEVILLNSKRVCNNWNRELNPLNQQFFQNLLFNKTSKQDARNEILEETDEGADASSTNDTENNQIEDVDVNLDKYTIYIDNMDYEEVSESPGFSISKLTRNKYFWKIAPQAKDSKQGHKKVTWFRLEEGSVTIQCAEDTLILKPNAYSKILAGVPYSITNTSSKKDAVVSISHF